MAGNFSKTQTVVTDQVITADLWNAEFDNIIDNMTPDGLDDASADTSAMQATADPYPSSTESLATSTKGELQRIRYQILELLKRFGKASAETKWYADVPYPFGIVGSNIASASEITIPNDGNYYVVTGGTAITSIATLGVGSRVTLLFESSLTLTHHSTDLILPDGTDITTEGGDVFDFVEYATGDWRLVSMSRPGRVTKWTSFTPTGAWSTNTSYTGFYRRVGDTLEVDVTVALSGAPTSAALTVNLPSGLTIDNAKLSGPGAEQVIGYGIAQDVNVGHFIPLTIFWNSTTAVSVYYTNIVGGNIYAEVNAVSSVSSTPFTWASGDRITFRYSVPISGWSAI